MHAQAQIPEIALRIDGRPFYGQAQAKNLLSRSLSGNRLAHAYLFRGPEGVGKQLFARGLAAAINCSAAETLSACGICPSCRKMFGGKHPDFLLISPEKGAIKIDQVRKLIKALSFAPYEAKTRITLIEDVHTMRKEAANSLLKTLEEPPDNNVLILTADSAGEVLQTIISRCQTIPFYGLSIPETAGILRQQDETLDTDTAMLLARLGEGSPGKAQLYHRKNLVEFWRTLSGVLCAEVANEDRKLGKLLLMAESMAALKEDLPHLFSLLKLWLRDGLFDCYGQHTGAEVVNTRKDWNSEQFFAKLQAINQAEKELGRNCNRTLVCEVLLFHLRK